jgi:hypothetical protein
VYDVSVDEYTQQQLDSLPRDARSAWNELRETLALVPGNGMPLNPAVTGGVLTWQFGPHKEGLAYYLVLERDQKVVVLEILWLI